MDNRNMKNMMKKILPLVLSVLFCLSASTTAFAAGGRTQETDVKTIVVNQDTLNYYWLRMKRNKKLLRMMY